MSATSFKTPEGTAIYPWLNIPDTQFDPEGKYKTDLRVNAKDAAELVEAITQVNKEAHGPKAAQARVPYKVDDVSGDYIFRLQTKYQPTLVDSSATVIPPSSAPRIMGGSTLRVKGTIKAYSTGGNLGANLQIKSVQVLSLSEEGASDFEPVEGGYVAEKVYASEPKAQQAEEGNQYDF